MGLGGGARGKGRGSLRGLRGAAGLLVVASLSLVGPRLAQGEEAVEEMQVGNRALALLEEPEVGEGRALPMETAAIGSTDPSVFLNYATLLFYNGRSLIGHAPPELVNATFAETEKALLRAIELSATDEDLLRRDLLRSQCAFLLGEIYRYIFIHPLKAKRFYQEAVRYLPEHTAALQAAERAEAAARP